MLSRRNDFMFQREVQTDTLCRSQRPAWHTIFFWLCNVYVEAALFLLATVPWSSHITMKSHLCSLYLLQRQTDFLFSFSFLKMSDTSCLLSPSRKPIASFVWHDGDIFELKKLHGNNQLGEYLCGGFKAYFKWHKFIASVCGWDLWTWLYLD